MTASATLKMGLGMNWEEDTANADTHRHTPHLTAPHHPTQLHSAHVSRLIVGAADT